MPIPLIVGAKKVGVAVCGAVARAARAPRAAPARPRPGYRRGRLEQVRPPARGRVDYRVPVYGGTAAVAAYGVGAGVDKAGEGIRDVGAGIGKAAPALPWITAIAIAIVGLIALKYFKRRR